MSCIRSKTDGNYPTWPARFRIFAKIQKRDRNRVGSDRDRDGNGKGFIPPVFSGPRIWPKIPRICSVFLKSEKTPSDNSPNGPITRRPTSAGCSPIIQTCSSPSGLACWLLPCRCYVQAVEAYWWCVHAHYQNSGIFLVFLSSSKTLPLVIAHENPH